MCYIVVISCVYDFLEEADQNQILQNRRTKSFRHLETPRIANLAMRWMTSFSAWIGRSTHCTDAGAASIRKPLFSALPRLFCSRQRRSDLRMENEFERKVKKIDATKT